MTPEEIDVYVRSAMRKAFTLGSTYWQLADSEYYSHNKKAEDTFRHYQDYTDEVTVVLSALGKAQ